MVTPRDERRLRSLRSDRLLSVAAGTAVVVSVTGIVFDVPPDWWTVTSPFYFLLLVGLAIATSHRAQWLASVVAWLVGGMAGFYSVAMSSVQGFLWLELPVGWDRAQQVAAWVFLVVMVAFLITAVACVVWRASPRRRRMLGWSQVLLATVGIASAQFGWFVFLNYAVPIS